MFRANHEKYEIKFLRIGQVIEMTGLSRSMIYHLINKNQFPSPIKLSERASGWEEAKVTEWQRSRLAADK